jgi:hypothetical protein
MDSRQPREREADRPNAPRPVAQARRRLRLSMPIGPLLALAFAIGIGLLLGQSLSPVEIVVICLGAYVGTELIFLISRTASALSRWCEEKRLQRQAKRYGAQQRREAQSKQNRDAQLLAGIREKAASAGGDPSKALGVNVRFLDAKGSAASRDQEPDDPWAEAVGRSRDR